MMHTARAFHGMIVTPHRLASESGIAILRKGGNAAQAAVAAAATLCVVYPHMTGLGGDTFWLILPGSGPGRPPGEPMALESCGRSAQCASQEWYRTRGCSSLPRRGPLAALTMAGAVAGWKEALEIASSWPGEGLGLQDLLADAISLAEEGFPVSSMQSAMTRAGLADLITAPGFGDQFLAAGKAPETGGRMRLSVLGRTLRRLLAEGLESFYTGSLAKDMAADLEEAGSPLRLADFAAHKALRRPPLLLRLGNAALYNTPPPTQGLASLMILGLLERYADRTACDLRKEDVLIHAVVEATKQAYVMRDRYLADPDHMERGAESLLDPALLDSLARNMSPDRALPWPTEEAGSDDPGKAGGDTVWFGAMDAYGNSVSCIQSIFHEFGSGLVLPRTGITWHNRGLGFAFTPGKANSLSPGKRPFHTLNPAMALLDDGRIVSYGTMGGEGQPQTQAEIFTRAVTLGLPPQAALSEARWLLGRSWGEQNFRLKLEAPVAEETVERLKKRGHITERVPALSSLMGHAGMLIRHPDGLLEGGFDPRSDGAVGCW